jgi:hypothetical protein
LGALKRKANVTECLPQIASSPQQLRAFGNGCMQSRPDSNFPAFTSHFTWANRMMASEVEKNSRPSSADDGLNRFGTI